MLKTFQVDSSLIIKVIGLLITLAKESPLTASAKGEFNAAIEDLEMANLGMEMYYRDGFIRALTHLESAYHLFLPTIKTWNFLDKKERVLWSKRTFANSICMHMVIIHYILGNIEAAKRILLEKVTDMGSIYFPDSILDSFSIPDRESFYKIVCQDDFYKIQNKIAASEINYDEAYSSPYFNDPGDEPSWMHWD